MAHALEPLQECTVRLRNQVFEDRSYSFVKINVRLVKIKIIIYKPSTVTNNSREFFNSDV